MFAALGIVSGLQRFVVTAGFVTAIILGLWAWMEERQFVAVHKAVVQRDAVWTERLADVTRTAAKARDEQQAKIDEDAAVARALAATDAIAASSRVAALETEIAAMKYDPVVFPRAIVRSLRR